MNLYHNFVGVAVARFGSTAHLVAVAILAGACSDRHTLVSGDDIARTSTEHHVAQFGALNPDAPPQLARFAFLLGAWQCEAALQQADGSTEYLDAKWVGRFVLDGYVVMDDFSMIRHTGERLVLGVNVRTYDVVNQSWDIRWLNALDGTWADLVSEEHGAIRFDGKDISYTFPEPTGVHALTRATYTDITPDRFTWRGERSDDGTQWEEFLRIECRGES